MPPGLAPHPAPGVEVGWRPGSQHALWGRHFHEGAWQPQAEPEPQAPLTSCRSPSRSLLDVTPLNGNNDRVAVEINEVILSS